MTSSGSQNIDQLSFASSGNFAIANLTPLGQTQLATLSLDKDEKNAIVLSDSNLKKLNQAGILDFAQDTGTYTLNIALATVAGAPPFTFVPATDGLWNMSPSSAAASQQLQITSAPHYGSETSALSALQLQLAAPTEEIQNPYLAGQSAKLMIVMHELFSIHEAMAGFDKDTFLKTFSRAIASVQVQIGAINKKIDAQNQRLAGDLMAAQMSIYASAAGMLLQASALGALQGIRFASRAKPEAAGPVASNNAENAAEQARANQVAKGALGSSITLRPDQTVPSNEQTARSNVERLAAPNAERLAAPNAEPNSSKLTLTPESHTADEPTKAGPSASAQRSKWSEFAEFNLDKNLLGPGAPLAQLFDSTFQRYINIEHSQQNMAANQALASAEGAEANSELQALLIRRQMESDRSLGSQDNDSAQQLLDLITSLSRSKVDNQRTLFRG